MVTYPITLQDLPEEIWKDIVGFELRYQISSLGRVKALERVVNNGRTLKAKIKKSFIDKWGYRQVILHKESIHTHIKIHIEVAKAFIDNPENKPTVNHKRGIKLDNRATELEWMTRSEQILHSYNILGTIHGSVGKISTQRKQVASFDKMTNNLLQTYDSLREAAEQTGLKYQNISACCNNRVKTCGSFIWKFI